MKRSILPLTMTAAAIALLAGCSSASAPSGVLGDWGEKDVAGQPTLTFSDDGNVHGNDGCNSLMGNYEMQSGDATRISFGMLASTMMYCEGVDTWLSMAAEAELDGNTLIVFDAEGAEIGSLTRA